MKRKSLDTTKDVKKAGGSDLIPTGCTMLNLALSDNPYGGYVKGCIVNIVGDRSSGKTFLSWNVLAAMNADTFFNGYDLCYDDAERRLRIAVEKMFGKKIRGRVKLEETDLIEDYYDRIQKKLDKKKPFVDILDSFDSLDDRESAKSKELKKDYPTKTALFTQMFRKIKGGVRKTDSLIVVVSQVRKTIGIVFGPKQYRTGGEALGHNSTYEHWLAQKGLVLKKGKETGIHVLLRITKNSATGKLRDVAFDILYDYGINNIGSMIDWMVEEKFWKKEKDKAIIDVGPDFGGRTTRDRLVKEIDREGREDELISRVAVCWKEVEDSIRTDLKPRYR